MCIRDRNKPQQFKKKEVELGLSDGIKIEVKKGITVKDLIRGNKIIVR